MRNPPRKNQLAMATAKLFKTAQSWFSVKLFHNYSHTGIVFNERADQLAERARQGLSMETWRPLGARLPTDEMILGQNLEALYELLE